MSRMPKSIGISLNPYKNIRKTSGISTMALSLFAMITSLKRIAENLPFWKKKKYKEWGREEFKTYLTELLAAKESFQYNTWNTALLRALIENIDIVVSEE